MNRRLFTAALSALLFTGAAAFAQTSSWTMDPNHTQVDFRIRHMALSTVHGLINGVSGTVVWDETDPSKCSVEATIQTATVNTNIDARNKHLKSPDFFDVEKYPVMTFKSTAVTRSNGKLQVVGDLTLTGVTKSVTLNVDGPTAPLKGPDGKATMGFSATGTLKRSDFNFGPKFKSPILGDEVQFTINVEANH